MDTSKVDLGMKPINELPLLLISHFYESPDSFLFYLIDKSWPKFDWDNLNQSYYNNHFPEDLTEECRLWKFLESKDCPKPLTNEERAQPLTVSRIITFGLYY